MCAHATYNNNKNHDDRRQRWRLDAIASIESIERLALDRARIVGAELVHGIGLGRALRPGRSLRRGVHRARAGDVFFDGGPIGIRLGLRHAVLLIARERVVGRRATANGAGMGAVDAEARDRGGDGGREGEHGALKCGSRRHRLRRRTLVAVAREIDAVPTVVDGHVQG